MKPRLSFKTLPAALCCLLLALVAWSCTADTDPLPDGGTTPADDPAALNFIIGPRPAFTEGTVVLPDGVATPSDTPATRLAQTEEAAKWEPGDVLWLWVDFAWIPKGATQRTSKCYASALRYSDPDGDGVYEWLPFTVQDSIDYKTDGIKHTDHPGSADEFVRQLRWPVGSLATGSTEAGVWINIGYFGNGIPVDGILTVGPTVDVMFVSSAGGAFLPGQPIVIKFSHIYSRLHITAGCKLEGESVNYLSEIDLSTFMLDVPYVPSLSIDVPAEGGDYFMRLSSPYLTLDGIRYDFTFGKNADGSPKWEGMSYTFTPVKNSGVAPGSE